MRTAPSEPSPRAPRHARKGRPRPHFALAVGGAAGGVLGSLFGHLAVVGLVNAAPSAPVWLKGAHGPPFFSLLLSSTFYHAGMGAGLYRGLRRLEGAATGAAAFAALFLPPMFVATRVFTWGELDPSSAWVLLVLAAYTAASAAALALIGSRCRASDRPFDWRTGAGALAGAGAAYLLSMILSMKFASMRMSAPPGVLPHLSTLVDSGVYGVLVGLGVSAASRP